MVAINEVHADWVSLLTYPAWQGDGQCLECIDRIRAFAPELTDDLEAFTRFSAEHSLSDQEEAFANTFDGNAERALEVGWHLHGENYARGIFMVRMRQLLRECEVAENIELPDHLSNVLSVLRKTKPTTAHALVDGAVLPALKKIVEGFGETDNPYVGVIKALDKYLAKVHCSTEGSESDE